MSNVPVMFAESIKDAENLLKHFNTLNTQPPPPDIEVLKRAGLVMAMTAWETYVEDRLLELVTNRLRNVSDRTVANFVRTRLMDELKRLNNPDSPKTIALFKDFVGIDLTNNWCWNNFDSKKVRAKLNHYLKLRGNVVHRSLATCDEMHSAHLVKKGDLERIIGFLKNLVGATEAAIISSSQVCISKTH